MSWAESVLQTLKLLNIYNQVTYLLRHICLIQHRQSLDILFDEIFKMEMSALTANT